MKPMCEPSSARIAQCRSCSRWVSIRSKKASSWRRVTPQDVLESGRDLGVVHPAQGVLEVERRLRRDQPDALPLQAHDRPSGIRSIRPRSGQARLGSS